MLYTKINTEPCYLYVAHPLVLIV